MSDAENTEKKQKRDWKAEFWPDVRTQAGAEKAAKQGATACFIVAVITLLVIVAFMFVDVGGAYSGVVDLWNLLDVGIAIALGIMIRRYWRAAAVLALIYYIVSRAMVWASAGIGSPVGVIMAIAILLLLVNGIRGTFALAAMRKQQPE